MGDDAIAWIVFWPARARSMKHSLTTCRSTRHEAQLTSPSGTIQYVAEVSAYFLRSTRALIPVLADETLKFEVV